MIYMFNILIGNLVVGFYGIIDYSKKDLIE